MASASACRVHDRRVELLKAAVRSYELLHELHWQESHCWPIAARECMEQIGAAKTARLAAQRCRKWAKNLKAEHRRRLRRVLRFQDEPR